MNRRKRIMLVLAIACGIALVLTLGHFLWGQVEYQTVSLHGYTMMIPEEWTVREEENTLFFKDNDEDIGLFSLFYSDIPTAEVPAALGFAPEKIDWQESDRYAVKVYEAEFRYDRASYSQYIFCPLPDAPPYQAILSLKGKSHRMSKRILESFRLPDLGQRAPEKPLAEPDWAFLEEAVYALQRKDEVYASHLNKLDRLIQAGAEQPMDDASVVHVISYDADENGKTVRTWYYLSMGAGQKKLFTYERSDDGQYYYKNNPKLIRNLTRQVSAEENYTRYMADDIVILETPYNVYTEHKNALFGLKGTLVGDNNKVSAIVQNILPYGVTSEGIALDTENTPYGVTIQYDISRPELYIEDGKLKEDVFYQNSLVLFSLIENVDWIQTEIRQGSDEYQLTYWRQNAEKQLDNQDLCGFAENLKVFEEFLENVPKISAPNDIDSGNGIDGTRLLLSKNVTLSPNARIPHPETGTTVSVRSYLLSIGLNQYLDKEVTVKLYETADMGLISMRFEISDGELPLGVFPVSSLQTAEQILNTLS